MKCFFWFCCHQLGYILLGTFKVFLVETHSLILVVFVLVKCFFWFCCHQIGYILLGYIQKVFLVKTFSLVFVIHFVYAINERVQLQFSMKVGYLSWLGELHEENYTSPNEMRNMKQIQLNF